MKRAISTAMCVLLLIYFQAQDTVSIDTIWNYKIDTENLRFGSEGFIDFSTIGAWNTSAQLTKFWIGEPGVFRIPFLIFAGATNLPFSDEEFNSTVVYDLVNPVGGNLSLAFDFNSEPIYKSTTRLTSLHWNLFGAAKMIRGRSLEMDTPTTDLGYFLEAGFTLRTGAGEYGVAKSKEPGVAFFSLKYVITQLDLNTMQALFDKSINPQGIRLEAGVLVKSRINLRLSYFEATVGAELPTLDKAQWRFGMDYRLTK